MIVNQTRRNYFKGLFNPQIIHYITVDLEFPEKDRNLSRELWDLQNKAQLIADDDNEQDTELKEVARLFIQLINEISLLTSPDDEHRNPDYYVVNPSTTKEQLRNLKQRAIEFVNKLIAL